MIKPYEQEMLNAVEEFVKNDRLFAAHWREQGKNKADLEIVKKAKDNREKLQRAAFVYMNAKEHGGPLPGLQL